MMKMNYEMNCVLVWKHFDAAQNKIVVKVYWWSCTFYYLSKLYRVVIL